MILIKSGESPAKKDWEVTKLKKRVDANEDGIDRLNDFFEELSKRVGKVDEKCDNLANKVGKSIINSISSSECLLHTLA